MTLNVPPPISSRSTGKKFSDAIGAGLQGAQSILQQYQQQQQMQQENEAIKQNFGIDLGGISDQKQRQNIVQEIMKSQNKAPAGGLTGQPIPPQVSQAMNDIIQRNPQASADEVKMMMDQSGIPPAYSNSFIENRRRQDETMAKTKTKREDLGHSRALKALDKADALGQELPLLESSINAMEDAVVNGDQSFWSLDNLAEMTGLELFRTAKGGQFKTAAKTYFINDLKASGARPNQFIEKQLADALARVGRSQEANQTVIESFKFSNDLKKKWHETARELEKFYEENNDGILPASFSRKVEEAMKPYAEMRQNAYEKKLKELHVQEKKKEMNKGKSKVPIKMRTPDGRSIEVPDEDLEEALSLGAMRE